MALRWIIYSSLVAGILGSVYWFTHWQAPATGILSAADVPFVLREPRDPLADEFPNIFMAAMQKSGSLYIKLSLLEGLRYNLVPLADWKNRNKVEEVANGHGMYTHEHLLPTNPENIKLLKTFSNRKIVVHVRDPRQVLLSWVHYAKDEYIKTNGLRYSFDHAPDYYDSPLEQQVEWSIGHRLPFFVQWVQGWVAVKEQEDKDPNGLRILFTTYDELIADEAALFNKIIDFYGIKHEHFTLKTPEKTPNVHYRRGDPNEWRSVYTDAQKRRIAKMVPKDLLKRFGWG